MHTDGFAIVVTNFCDYDPDTRWRIPPRQSGLAIKSRLSFERSSPKGFRSCWWELPPQGCKVPPIVTEDIDLWFAPGTDPLVAKAAHAAGVVYVPGGVAMNPPTFGGSQVRLDQVLTLSGLDSFESEMKNTIHREINGIPVLVLSLERIIKSKRAANRAKDRAVLPALEATLMAIRSIDE